MIIKNGRFRYPQYQLSADREDLYTFDVNGRPLYASYIQTTKTVKAILGWAADEKLFPPSLIIHPTPVPANKLEGEPHNGMVMLVYATVQAEVSFGDARIYSRLVEVTFYHYEYNDGRGEVPNSRRWDVKQLGEIDHHGNLMIK